MSPYIAMRSMKRKIDDDASQEQDQDGHHYADR